MRYYVMSDIHSFFTKFKEALTEKGFFEDKEEHKLILCGDLFDRGREALELQEFILDLLDRDEVILIKGNHEDLMLELIKDWEWEAYYDYAFIANGTVDTVLQLTACQGSDLSDNNKAVLEKMLETPYIKKIIPAMKDYFETEHYIFVHGWIPCVVRSKNVIPEYRYSYMDEWRKIDDDRFWKKARWVNGMEAAYVGITERNKTIVCGHYHCSFGHSVYENDGEKLAEDSNFSPYYGKGVIAIDACTAFSGQVNCIVIED